MLVFVKIFARSSKPQLLAWTSDAFGAEAVQNAVLKLGKFDAAVPDKQPTDVAALVKAVSDLQGQLAD